MSKTITLIKQRLISVKTHPDKHIHTLVMTFKQLTSVRSYYLGMIAGGVIFEKKISAVMFWLLCRYKLQREASHGRSNILIIYLLFNVITAVTF